MQQGASSESNPLTNGQTGHNYESSERYGTCLTTDALSKSGKLALRQSKVVCILHPLKVKHTFKLLEC